MNKEGDEEIKLNQESISSSKIQNESNIHLSARFGGSE